MAGYCSLRRIKSKNVCIVERQSGITAVRIISLDDAKLLFRHRKSFEAINLASENPCNVLAVFPCDTVLHCVKF